VVEALSWHGKQVSRRACAAYHVARSRPRNTR
jgi:hypothetical protein